MAKYAVVDKCDGQTSVATFNSREGVLKQFNDMVEDTEDGKHFVFFNDEDQSWTPAEFIDELISMDGESISITLGSDIVEITICEVVDGD